MVSSANQALSSAAVPRAACIGDATSSGDHTCRAECCCVFACATRHVEKRLLPFLPGRACSAASSSSRAVYSASAVLGLCAKVQPGAVQGRGLSSPGTMLCDSTSLCTLLGALHFFNWLCISAGVLGVAGTVLNARSLEHSHHPDAARCSQCLSAATSVVQ